MLKHFAVVAALAALFVVGCTPKAEEAPKDGEPKQEQKGPEKTAQGDTTIELADVPESLRHAAFRFSGYDADKSLRYDVTLPQQSDSTSTRVVTLLAGEDGTVRVREQYTDALSSLGSLIYEVNGEGVFGSEATAATLEGKSMVLPADVAVGKTWDSTGGVAMASGGSSVEFKSTSTAEAMEKVTVPAGEFDALKVVTTGEGTVDVGDGAKPAKIEQTTWYAEGIGPVKIEMAITVEGQQPLRMSLRLAEE